eukprot:scaffold1320_cov253-Pinguiococcus_pyrenoidosus.AAC.2
MGRRRERRMSPFIASPRPICRGLLGIAAVLGNDCPILLLHFFSNPGAQMRSLLSPMCHIADLLHKAHVQLVHVVPLTRCLVGLLPCPPGGRLGVGHVHQEHFGKDRERPA